MKRFFLFLLIVTMFSTFAFAGGDGEKSERKYSAIMGSSNIGGGWYPLASKMAGVIMKYSDEVITVLATGGGSENVRLLRQEQCHIGIAEPNIVNYAWTGTRIFKDDGKHDNLTFLFNLYSQPMTAIVHKGGSIYNLDDFSKEKSGKSYGFSPGTAGSGDEMSWEEVFEIIGIPRSEMIWKPLFHHERAMAFKDRILDCVAFETAQPSGAIMELSSQNPIRIIEIKGEQREKILKAYPWYDYYTLPAGMYNGQDEAVETIYIGGFVIANKDVPEDYIYNFVKAIFEPDGLEELHTVFPAAKEISLDNALNGNSTEWLPIHPGAKKYYKEVGLIIALPN